MSKTPDEELTNKGPLAKAFVLGLVKLPVFMCACVYVELTQLSCWSLAADGQVH